MSSGLFAFAAPRYFSFKAADEKENDDVLNLLSPEPTGASTKEGQSTSMWEFDAPKWADLGQEPQAAAGNTSAATAPGPAGRPDASEPKDKKAAQGPPQAMTGKGAPQGLRARSTNAPAGQPGRNFINRPIKKEHTPGAAGQPPPKQQQHSYLQQSAAKPRKQTAAVDSLASFLRPTAASWGRVSQSEVRKAPSAATKSRLARSGDAASARAVKRIETETTEERELREAAQARQRLHQQRKLNQTAMERNRVIRSTAAAPLRSAKALTIPRSPRMHASSSSSSSRALADQPPAPPAAHLPRARHPHPPPPPAPAASSTAQHQHHHQRLALTVPQGPHLHTEARLGPRKPPAALEDHLTPPPAPHHQHHDSAHPRVTVPHPPRLLTDARAATRSKAQGVGMGSEEGGFKSAREREDEEELKRQFRARPLDRRVLESNGEMGVPKVTPCQVTQPQPFHLETDTRCRRVPGSREEEDDAPLRRSHGSSSMQSQGSGGNSNSTKPMQLVVPEPFHLQTDRRGQMHQMALEQRLAWEREVEAARRKTQAQPMPRFSRPFMPQPSHKELTEFQDFKLQSVRLHEEARARQEERLRWEREEQVRQAVPKALPLPASTFRKTFEVQPAPYDPVVPHSPQLTSSVRAEERRAFDEEVRAKQEEARLEHEAALAEQKRLEDEELRRLRTAPVEEGGMAFRAKPILRNSHPLVPGPSARKLTVPVSPKLHTSTRPKPKR